MQVETPGNLSKKPVRRCLAIAASTGKYVGALLRRTMVLKSTGLAVV